MKNLKCIVLPACYKTIRVAIFSLCLLTFLYQIVDAQDYEIHKKIKGAVIYDYDRTTKLGNDVFSIIIADLFTIPREPLNMSFL